jgi:hypothetical protein
MAEAILGLMKAFQDVFDLVKDIHVDKEAMSKYLRVLITFATFATTCSGLFVYFSAPPEKELVSYLQDAQRGVKSSAFADWLLKKRIYELKDSIRDHGKTFRVPNSELDVTTLKMMDFVNESMVATSSDLAWWQTHCDYSAKNANLATARKITRIFLYRSESELQSLAPVLQAQKDQGIEVFTAPVQDNDRPVDYVVIDHGTIAGRLILGKDRKPIRAEFNFDKADIDSVQDRIDVIRARAKRF